MNEGVALLEHLSEADTDWILARGTEMDLAEGERPIEAGRPVDALAIVLQGQLGVFADEVGTRLAVLGPGDLVGGMSFVHDEVPTETVRALETTRLLSIPYGELHARGAHDPAFSARLHRGLATLLTTRLRSANRRLAVLDEPGRPARAASPAWARLSEPLEELKRAAVQAEEVAAGSGDLPEEVATAMVERFLDFCALQHEVFSQVANDRVREELGLRLQRELLPYALLSAVAERGYRKPRGYAGDFWTIELLYRNEPGGSTALARMMDRCFLQIPASRALRNRRGLMAEEIGRALRAAAGRPARVTSLACGPAREVFDVFADLEDPRALEVTLLDIDLQALAFVAERARDVAVDRQVRFVSENLVRLAVGKAQTDIGEQDLIYSIGLIDYFGDDLVVRLMNLIHTMLRPGGRVVLGNFHPRHQSKELMDHVLDWELVHRTEEDMDRLYETSAFARPCTNIRFEAEGINLFAECVR